MCVLDAMLHQNLIRLSQLPVSGRHCRRLADAARRADGRAESPLETLGRLGARQVLPDLEPQVRVLGGARRLDLGCRRLKVALEGSAAGPGRAGPGPGWPRGARPAGVPQAALSSVRCAGLPTVRDSVGRHHHVLPVRAPHQRQAQQARGRTARGHRAQGAACFCGRSGRQYRRKGAHPVVRLDPARDVDAVMDPAPLT